MSFNPIKFATRQIPGKSGVSLSVSAGSYSIDIGSLSQQLGSELFIPQSMTVDASALNVGQYVTVNIPAIGYNHFVPGAKTKTFHLPPIEGGTVINVTPSDGASTIPLILYDYLVRPDSSEPAVTQGSVASATDNQSLTAGGSDQLVANNISGVLKALSIQLAGAVSGAAGGGANITIQDGNAQVIAIARVSIQNATTLIAPVLLLNMTDMNLDFKNGLSSTIATNGTAFASGSIDINLIYRT